MASTASPRDPWLIHFFQRHPSDDPGESVPARDFFDGLAGKVAAEIHAVLDAVAEAPPPSFAGGGKWEVMHGDMAGVYEVRVQGDGRNHRLFCLLVRNAADLGVRRSFASAASRSPGAERPSRRTMRASGRIARSSSGTAAYSTDAGLFERFGGQLHLERFGECHERRQGRVGAFCREEAPNHFGAKVGPAGKFGLAQFEAAAALVQDADDRVDLVDTSARGGIGEPVFRVALSRRQVALRASAYFNDGQNYNLEPNRAWHESYALGSGRRRQPRCAGRARRHHRAGP